MNSGPLLAHIDRRCIERVLELHRVVRYCPCASDQHTPTDLPSHRSMTGGAVPVEWAGLKPAAEQNPVRRRKRLTRYRIGLLGSFVQKQKQAWKTRPSLQTRRTGLEPATSGSTVRCSNQLSYHPKCLLRRRLSPAAAFGSLCPPARRGGRKVVAFAVVSSFGGGEERFPRKLRTTRLPRRFTPAAATSGLAARSCSRPECQTRSRPCPPRCRRST